ncbi:MAG: RecQ family ATP-dependent DNA helicase [Defluviitaleaceae bacterium]|nr:RecQ family ATP-dependent DNA helicase [Defluviitaleaceae bacterium]
MTPIIFVDVEIALDKIADIGAIGNHSQLRSPSLSELARFAEKAEFVCGHNIIKHDLQYIGGVIPNAKIIDTLYLSPLLFPAQPYHALLKDDKLQADELNNPLNDAIKARDLLNDEIAAFEELRTDMQDILYDLLHTKPQFSAFFEYLTAVSGFRRTPTVKFLVLTSKPDTAALIKEAFRGKICELSPISELIRTHPIELAYSLALITTGDPHSLTPPWVHKNFPAVSGIMNRLRNTPCSHSCEYCKSTLNLHKCLDTIFGLQAFRTYNGQPLQEKAALAALGGKSFLAVFPTGGGKSLTFQLPALIAGEAVRGLTVVISPLQSLMKDQVDNLNNAGIHGAVTINGLLSPLERAEAIECVHNGLASILYISPEQLRSKTIERLLQSRHIVRFVIDEAHCFSSWGQEFRVDYLYIGDFLAELKKQHPIPVSCFTATAKQKVISDICEYFSDKLNLSLDLYATDTTRKNLSYQVLYREENDKYYTLRDLIGTRSCPVIVYASRTRRVQTIADKLINDGYAALPFHGKLDAKQKVENQNSFMQGQTQIIVATKAFGMGVDKKDIGMIIHYDISDSLEDYVQESGRAARDESLQAMCYVLFNDNDLNKHFILLNQTKLSINEINQVWKAVKDLTRERSKISRSPLEIARQAGWDDSVIDIETRVKTAISALEVAGYLKRGKNAPQIFATSIIVKTMAQASEIIQHSPNFSLEQKEHASRILSRLFSSRSTQKDTEGESRVDYLSDILGIDKQAVISSIGLMRENGLLADTKDLTAYITESASRVKRILGEYVALEDFLINLKPQEDITLKELNNLAHESGITHSTIKSIKTILYYWTIKGFIRRPSNNSSGRVSFCLEIDRANILIRFFKRTSLAAFIIKYLFEKNQNSGNLVSFSVLDLKEAFMQELTVVSNADTTLEDVEDALLYLSKIQALALDGGFLVLYNAMEINRINKNNRVRYKEEDYSRLDEFYKHKIQQIHIIGELASIMVRDYNEALQFVRDYFQMDYKGFITKYFKGGRAKEISRNITSGQYQRLFGSLSTTQRAIIDDGDSKYIAVIAGPGSGKTRVLVHKLAALYQMEDVKHQQLLMLTFSRAAATEFKKRLIELIGNAAHFIDITTFHSYAFNLLGRVGNLEDSALVVKKATEMINAGQAEQGLITKTVIVIDEAQDMDRDEYNLVQALMNVGESTRLIAVGDDDQNIFEFRGSDSGHLKKISENAAIYNMLVNYRSRANIAATANEYIRGVRNRLKAAQVEAATTENGVVQITKHESRHLETPIVEKIKNTLTSGTAAVLTNTNDEALRVMCLLQKENIPARLIQEQEGFSLANLSEIRYFLKCINKNSTSALISDSRWQDAKARLQEAYKASACLPGCMSLLNEFENSNRSKYKTDLQIFITESKFEDFFDAAQGEVIVSTIHKAKGREFDSVYMMLPNAYFAKDEEKRKIYVGITRAKKELYIHYCGNAFDSLHLPGIERKIDTREYNMPRELITRLSHKDVFLGFFADKKKLILGLRSGEALAVRENSLFYQGENGMSKVAVFSSKFKARCEELKGMGYSPQSATIRFIVAWTSPETGEELAIILPDVEWGRNVMGGGELREGC